jgi:hypothetical protein
MRAFATFAVAWFLSMVMAQIVAQQLAIYFGTRDELILVMFIIGAFAVVSLSVLTMAFIGGAGVRPIDIAGGIAATLAVLLVCGITLYGMARNNWNLPTRYDMQIIVEIICPSLMVVLIQWWFLRRYRLRNAEQEPLP